MSVNPGQPTKWQTRTAGLPRQGRDVEIDTSPAERAEIASKFDLVDLPDFRARLRLVPAGRDGVRLTGTLEAEVRQACVVTLEPVESRILEEIERVFVPEAGARMPEEPDIAQAEIFVDLDAADPPEPFDGIALDLKAVLLEAFALALDPYPRKPGARAGKAPGGAPAQEGPFATLEQLKGAGKQEKP